jgi:uncharacterized protein YdeI (YjbR/CyaY-like superfamily)
MNTTGADSWLVDGCGRCDHYQTPQCKVLLWTEPLRALRALLLASGLKEEMKWGSPAYTLDGKNVVILGALRDCCTLGFFKGALLPNEAGALKAPGPNSQAARQLEFRTLGEVQGQEALIRATIAAAIEVERSGAKVEFARNPEPVPEELQAVLDADPALQAAFDALTPGRRRSHILHVSGAKQAKSRADRAARCAEKIREGKGFLDR